MAPPGLNRVIRFIALAVVLGVALYGLVLTQTDAANSLGEQLSQLSLPSLALPLGLSLLSYGLRFLRWRLILNGMGYRLPVKLDAIVYLSGFALTMTPGKSGETIRSAFLLQARVPIPNSLSAFVIERCLDVLIVASIATALLASMMASLVLISAGLALIMVLASSLSATRVQRLGSRWPRCRPLINALSVASATLTPGRILLYALLGASAWAAQGIGFFTIVQLFTQDIALSKAISIYCAGLFAGAASLIPGGLGVTEGSLAWLLHREGLDQGSAILSALVSRGCTLWLAVAIGCAALLAIARGATETSTDSQPTI
jgi:glycosyltransferase 2 family protein